ncbi:hypothetical protein D6C78_06160 [Aureobasidium pullulans]|uniref:Uncharacterized protein n=1 Tax=Aureobasidium pullulans TaxID=5580 RepID=A0A4V4LEB5_AURPU|nr:hypothetical protein D6C78_06160 [Aureobasidium pullulans]
MNWVNELEKAIELINAEESTIVWHMSILYFATPLQATLVYATTPCLLSIRRLSGVDGVRDELSDILEEVAEDLKSRRPSDWYIHQMTWTETDVEEWQAELAEIERLAHLEEGREEDDDDDEEAEFEEEEAELSPTELAAPNKATDEESDTRMRARNKTADAVDATQPDT